LAKKLEILHATQKTEKFLIDHEQTIKDLCAKCNNQSLVHYDAEGIVFIKAFKDTYNAENSNLIFNTKILGWIIKTHLNHIRLFKDKKHDEHYSINQTLIHELIDGEIHSFSLFQLFIEGWQGEEYFWDPESPQKISFFSYTSVQFIRQEILVSNLRLKFLDTFLFLPSNDNYFNFDNRVKETLNEMAVDNNICPSKVDIQKAIQEGKLHIEKIVPLSELKKNY